MYTFWQVLVIVFAVCVGFMMALLKDYIQQKIFMKHLKVLGEDDSNREMEKILAASGFALNEDIPADVDSKGIESNYKGYFS